MLSDKTNCKILTITYMIYRLKRGLKGLKSVVRSKKSMIRSHNGTSTSRRSKDKRTKEEDKTIDRPLAFSMIKKEFKEDKLDVSVLKLS